MATDKLAPGVPAATPLRLQPWEAIDRGVPVDYHNHTTFTDGSATVGEMAAAGVSAGITEMLFSDHVRHTSTYFHYLVREVRAVSLPTITAYVGAEAKILDRDGHLDCPESVWTASDALIGSVHSAPPAADGAPQRWREMTADAAVELEFELALAIVAKSRAHILGHPLGISVTTFKVQPLDHLFRLACACRDHDKAFELSPRYCANPGQWLELVKRAGCKVSLGSDAHATANVGTAWRLFVEKAGLA